MLNKAFTGFVVTFWLVMMTMLIRVEYFPRESTLLSIPIARVADKFFHAPDPSSLDVIYRGSKIGALSLDVTPRTMSNAEAANKSPHIDSYVLSGNLTVNLIVFGNPSRLHIHLESLFDPKYAMKTYEVQSEMGDSHTVIRGDNLARELDVKYWISNERPTQQHLAYDDLGKLNVLDALGLPALPGLMGAGAAGPGGAHASEDLARTVASHLSVHTYLDNLTTPQGPRRAYLIEILTDQNLNMWAKIWVDEQGGVLMADSSIGLSLRSDGIGNDGKPVIDRTFERMPRYKHDPH